MSDRRRAFESAIVGIYTILLVGGVVCVLSIGKEICVPIALAALVTFLLAPAVTRLERWVGRVTAVIATVVVLSGFIGVIGYVVANQVIDLTAKLPDYEANIQSKLSTFRSSSDGRLARVAHSIEMLRRDLPGADIPATDDAGAPVAVRVVKRESRLADSAQSILGPLFSVFAMAGLVLLLTVFMLLRREDLRGRLIRLIGQGRISVATLAMAEAGRRVSKYLLMQLIINATYGVPVAIGLFFIGVPNALLWGFLAIVLRFIPYVGTWVAAALPIALSLAVSDGWMMPCLTIGLFIVLELVTANVVEPWLFGASTGVSSLAVILAAVFWGWLWGPIGLVLSTPLTVCLVVIGRNVPKLAFLSVLLSDDEPLAPHQECYHRLLRSDLTEGTALVDRYLQANPVTALYDNVLIPVLIAAETDHGQHDLDAEQRAALHQCVRDILDDLMLRQAATTTVAVDQILAADGSSTEDVETQVSDAHRVLCIPVRALRDELSADMLTHALAELGYDAETLSSKATAAELVDLVTERDPVAVCISVVAPSAIIHARHLCGRLHRRLPALKVIVGLWGQGEISSATVESLRASGAQAVVTTLAGAVAEFGTIVAVPTPSTMGAADRDRDPRSALISRPMA